MIDKTKQKPKLKNSKIKVKTAKVATRVPGRPAAVVNLPLNKKFSVASIYESLDKKVTKVTIGKRIAEALAKKQIKLVEKKITHESGKGQPQHFFLKISN